jgi:ketopantoate reductase
VVTSPADLEWLPGDVVLLAVKSQDTAEVLDQLVDVAPPDTPIAPGGDQPSRSPSV